MDVLWINVEYVARLIKRFTLQTSKRIQEALPLLRLVVPVTSVDDLLKDHAQEQATKDISAASGWTAYFTVPEGKRWFVRCISREGTTGNSKIRVYDSATGFEISAQGTAAEYFLNLQLPMKEGWSVDLKNTNNGADTSIQANIIYDEDEAY